MGFVRVVLKLSDKWSPLARYLMLCVGDHVMHHVMYKVPDVKKYLMVCVGDGQGERSIVLSALENVTELIGYLLPRLLCVT